MNTSESLQSSYQALLTENAKLKEELKELKNFIVNNKKTLPSTQIQYTKTYNFSNNTEKTPSMYMFPPPMHI